MNKMDYQRQMEQFCLGSILNEPSLMEETKLLPEHFIDSYNKQLFFTLLEFKKEKESIDIFSLAGLGESKQMTFGGMDYLSQLLNTVPSVSSFKKYEQNILSFHTINRVRQLATNFLDHTTETHNIKDLLAFIQKINQYEIAAVQPKKNLRELLKERAEYHKNSPKKGLSGIDTGFLNLNLLTDGWQKSDLIIIGARPSMGKTAFILNSVLNGCAKKKNQFCNLFSIEMSEGQIIDRMIAIEGRLILEHLRNPNKRFTDKEWTIYEKAIQSLENRGIDVRTENKVPDMRAVLRKNMRDYPEHDHYVVIDFLTMMKPVEQKATRHQEVEEMVLDLKQMAKDFHVPVIVLAQLSRGVETRQDKRPTMADLRESGSIEQTGDIVAFLYRDDYYHPDSKEPGITEFLIEKHRNGKTGTLKFQFAKASNRFVEILPR